MAVGVVVSLVLETAWVQTPLHHVVFVSLRESSATHQVCFQPCKTGQHWRVLRIKWARARELSGAGQLFSALSAVLWHKDWCAKGSKGLWPKSPEILALSPRTILPRLLFRVCEQETFMLSSKSLRSAALCGLQLSAY